MESTQSKIFSARSKILSSQSKTHPDDQTEFKEHRAALTETINLILPKKMEENAQMDHYMVAQERMTIRLEEATQPIFEEKAEYEQRLAAMLEMIDERVLEITEKRKAECDLKLAAMSEMIDKRVLEIMEIQKAEFDLKLAGVSARIDEQFQKKAEEDAQMDHYMVALERMTIRLDEATEAIFEESMEFQEKLATSDTIDLRLLTTTQEKAVCEQKLANMSATIDKLVLERAEEKAEYEQRLAAMSEMIDERVLEITEIQKAECDLKLAGMSARIDELFQKKAEEDAQMDHYMVALERMIIRLDKATEAIFEESMEFQEKSATSDTIDLRLLTTTQEKITATSTDPITITPAAPGSCDPSSVQSNSSELLKSNHPHLHEALSQEETCSSCFSLVESSRSKWRDIDDSGLDIRNKAQHREEETQTAALDSSSVLQIQEEVRLPLPEQSPDPETPAVEQKMEANHWQIVLETSDELSLGPERPAEVEKIFRLLNADEWFMKTVGLTSIRRLAMDQPETLFPKMEEICLVIVREVMNPWYLVSGAALQTLAVLLSFLKWHFDPFLDCVAEVLFLKSASDNETLQGLTNEALDEMTQSCSPLLCMKALLRVLRFQSMPDPDQEAVARECFAVHLLALVESVRYEPEMHEVFLSVRHLTQDTSEVVRSCAEKTLAVLSKHLEEGMEFQEKSATSDAIDLGLLTTTQEKMTATSTDPITTTPAAPGSCDPSSVQSNSSELPPPEQSLDPETPAVEQKMEANHWQNVLETSDELSLGPEQPAEVEECFRLLNSDERFMKIEGLMSIQQLAMDRPETLFPIMEEICLVILREVMNPLILVSVTALRTLADLLALLNWHFDPFLDCVVEVLFLKVASDSEDQLLANMALDQMTQSCSPLLCMKALLSVLRFQSIPDPDQEAVARECFAAHVLALVEFVRYGPEMHEVLLSVWHLTQDTSEVVRSCAEKTLAVLSKHLEESLKFQLKSATSDTIDLRLLTTTQEKMTATSTDPITTTPAAPGPCNPSSVQSNSSELPPPEQSLDPETPAVEQKMEANHWQNVLETSDELQLGPERPAEVEKIFRLLNSDERFMKLEGLLSIHQLAMDQPETLFPIMEEVCLVIVREVMNPWYLVSGAALRTLADLLSFLKWHFDPFLDSVAEVLFLKAASDSKTVQRLINVALDEMTQSCSPLLCMKALLRVLRFQSMPDPDQEAVAREYFALYLLGLVQSVPYEPEMHEVFLSVKHLTQDTLEVVRSCAEKALDILSKHLEVSQ